jgi:hypothetical protein
MRLRTLLLLVYVFTSVPQIHAEGAAVSPISLVGKWSGTEHVANGATRVIEIEIRQNLRFAGSAAVDGKVYWTYGGTWELKDNQILWHYDASSRPLPEKAKADIDDIVSVDAEKMVLHSRLTGKQNIFLRAK